MCIALARREKGGRTLCKRGRPVFARETMPIVKSAEQYSGYAYILKILMKDIKNIEKRHDKGYRVLTPAVVAVCQKYPNFKKIGDGYVNRSQVRPRLNTHLGQL